MMRRRAFPAGIAAALLSLSAGTALARELDPFTIGDKVSATPARAMTSGAEGTDPCQFGPPGTPLGLAEAVERAICHNPQSRQAWANAKAQAAAVGVRLSAYLPTVSASFGNAKQKNSTEIENYGGYGPFNTSSRPTIRSTGLKLSWMLTDFGLRSAQLEQARALLDAANATHDATLQAALLNAAQTYFDTLTALAALDAANEAENAAKESFLAAEAKYKAGVGGLTDQLQASTAYAQARLDRVTAGGDLKNAQGSLAIAMGLTVSMPLVLVRHNGALPDTAFVKAIDDLIDDAQHNHPSLLAAQAELAAAKASVDAVRAEGRPSIALTSEFSRQNQLGQPPSLGLQATSVTSTSNAVGVQLTIPLFEGFGRGYRIKTAEGQAESKAAELEKAKRQVTLDVWKSYQLLETESANLKAAGELVSNARESFNVARGRYKAGVGNIIELLNAQSALANAERQRIKSVSNWHTARLKLAASVGKIGLWAIR